MKKMFRAVFKATLKEYLRDKGAWFWHLAFPVIFIIVFGLAFSGISSLSSQKFKVGVVIDSHHEIADKIIKEMNDSDAFKVTVKNVSEEKSVLEALKKGKYNAILKLTNIKREKLEKGLAKKLLIYYDVSKRQTNYTLLATIEKIVVRTSLELNGGSLALNVKPKSVYTHSLNYSNFTYILPGLLALVLMQLGLFSATQFLSLKEQKIIRTLGSTPLSMKTILSSDILLRLIIALVQTILILSIGKVVFGLQIYRNIFLLLFVVALGSLAFTSMGYMFTVFIKTSEAGQGIIQAIQLPMLFLSGTFIPIENMPAVTQPIIRVIPLTYLADAMRQVVLGFSGVFSLTTDILILSICLVGTFIITVRFWKWE